MIGNHAPQPLLISSLLTHAERHHGEQQVVSRRVEGDTHRCSYRDLARRSRSLAAALGALGIGFADRVATLAWNGHRHLELAYAVSGSGAVLHALSPRMGTDQLAWTSRHAKDRILFFDVSFLPIVEVMATKATTITTFVALTDREHMPLASAGLRKLLCYEDLIDGHGGRFEWPVFDENSASSLCYTLGPGGVPKGVLYSHRSTLLQAFAAAQPDAFGCSAADTLLPVVPMSQGNAWGLPYVACMVGAKLALPGPWLDGDSLLKLVEAEGVTVSAAAPHVWRSVLSHAQSRGLGFGRLRRMIIDGALCPPAEGDAALPQRHEVQVLHAWGTTDTHALGAVCALKPGQMALGADQQLAVQPRQGRPAFGVEMKIVGDDGRELPHDGVSRGRLLMRGPWVAAGYYQDEDEAAGAPDVEGWFPTDELATIDPNGLLHFGR
ncbi:AMP-binding protein [Sphaerotilaceae bacterium SBD11-9]